MQIAHYKFEIKPMTKINSGEVAAVVLAGGRSRRMGGRNKLHLPFGEQSLLERVLARLQPQSGLRILNCNEHRDKLIGLPDDLPVVADWDKGAAGPLDGLISTMEWLLVNAPVNGREYRWLLSAPVDCPFLPEDLLDKLSAKIEEEKVQIAVASYAGRQHYTCALWALTLADEGRTFIRSGSRALQHFIADHPHTVVEFTGRAIDPFFNINTPEDYENALGMAELTRSRSRL